MRQNIILILGLMIISSFSIGCSKSNSGKKFDSARTRFSDQNLTFGAEGQSFVACMGIDTFKGTIFSNGYGSEFSNTIYAFLTGLGDPDTFLGDIDGSCGSNTGMAFKGQVSIPNGFNKNGNNNYGDIVISSKISLLIVDYWAAQGIDSPINISQTKSASGFVDGDWAEVLFELETGLVIFQGYIDYNKQTFSSRGGGEVSFENKTHFDGGDGYNGDFGDFEVPLCSFFECR